MTICTCAMHCTRSGYHERACCDGPLCDCWCHTHTTQPQDPTRYADHVKRGAGWKEPR